MIAKVFYSMFEMEKTYSEVRLNPDFEQKVLKWLDNNEAYLKQAHRQVVYSQLYSNELKN